MIGREVDEATDTASQRAVCRRFAPEDRQKGESSKASGLHLSITMVFEQLAFGLFALVTLGASLGVVLVRDVWHAALLLGVALSSVALHYIMLTAEFVAMIQILVYIGGVLILITFGVMLTREDDPQGVETVGDAQVDDESEVAT